MGWGVASDLLFPSKLKALLAARGREDTDPGLQHPGKRVQLRGLYLQGKRRKLSTEAPDSTHHCLKTSRALVVTAQKEVCGD